MTKQAESIAVAEAFHDDLATKADLREMGTRQKADLNAATSELKTGIAETKAEIVKWMFGTIGFQTLIILGAVIALAKLVHP